MYSVQKHNHRSGKTTTEHGPFNQRRDADAMLDFEYNRWSRNVGIGGIERISATEFLVTDTSGEPHYSFEINEP